MEAVRKIHRLRVRPPVKLGQVLIENFLDKEGIHVVACRSMDKQDQRARAAPSFRAGEPSDRRMA